MSNLTLFGFLKRYPGIQKHILLLNGNGGSKNGQVINQPQHTYTSLWIETLSAYLPSLNTYGAVIKKIGTVKNGGVFSPTEVVIQSGPADSNDWIVQRLNARADFKKLLGRDPKDEAYGVGILVDTGMEVDFAKITALRE